MKPEEAREMLEAIALREAAETATRGTSHASRLACFPCGSWQASVIAKAQGTVRAETAGEFRAAMENPEASVVFLPQTAPVTAEIIERICIESPLEKFVVWEID